ncbi:type II toxin-antitoxin system antitoxin DNA ADP-ribosyl glycohydrolase DarG [Flavobacterium restrictum]|uniref:Macro domain-containing protein n=1 Tax=Flavobacterium restrictum TaxID=2594428 RepID=A0A553E3E5_9FLAO|nr:macro domain-containing protein [Flavobacterium restrictum]TRX39500.1 macro domain-containing protein [Flavobacterium restrictum]
MIKYVTGNIFDSDAEALVNTVNTDGVMGKGIALQFKNAFPINFKLYQQACKDKIVAIGNLFVTKDSNITSGTKYIINFPTKQSWRKPSEYSFIEAGLDDLINVLLENNIKSIAIPPLGAGNGGLEWERVKNIIEGKLSKIDIDVLVYEPTAIIKEHLKSERIKLTDARALLLYILYDLVKNGEYVSEFSSEKVCYFLQKLGAEKYFKLQFTPNFYGPYSGKVKYVLNILNGSYIMGYSDMNKKPFEPITLVADGYDDVKKHIESNENLSEIANKTTKFLNGFYSDFALELLSSLDYLSTKYNTTNIDELTKKLEFWSDRKRSLFSNPKYIHISIKHLQKIGNNIS